LIDARERDLDDEAPASLATLEDYAEAIVRTACLHRPEILGVATSGASSGRHVGIGYALAGLLRAMPYRQRAALSVPVDIATRAGLTIDDYRALRTTAALRAGHYGRSRSGIPPLGLARAIFPGR